MRDPARIPVVLDELRKAWEREPDMRLCQLINAVVDQDPFYRDDPYYLEDDRLVERIRQRESAWKRAEDSRRGGDQ